MNNRIDWLAIGVAMLLWVIMIILGMIGGYLISGIHGMMYAAFIISVGFPIAFVANWFIKD